MCGKADKVATYNTGISSRHWLVSWLLYFQSSFLLMAWKKGWKVAQVFGSLPCRWGTWMKLLAMG